MLDQDFVIFVDQPYRQLSLQEKKFTIATLVVVDNLSVIFSIVVLKLYPSLILNTFKLTVKAEITINISSANPIVEFEYWKCPNRKIV